MSLAKQDNKQTLSTIGQLRRKVLKGESSLISSTLRLNWLLYEQKRSGQFMHVSAFCPFRATYALLTHYKITFEIYCKKRLFVFSF